MEQEKKIVFRVLLTYILYGVFYIFTLGDFIVPLPVIYLAIPLVAIYFFIRSIQSNKSWFLLLLPFIVLKDVMMELNINFVAFISYASLVSWALFGLFILRQKLIISTIQKVYGFSLMATLLTLIPFAINPSWFILPIVGLFGYLFMKKLEGQLPTFDENIKNENVNNLNVLVDDTRFLNLSKPNAHQITLQRINLLILLISGFYIITLFSIWTTTW
jgi:hypothetical protein